MALSNLVGNQWFSPPYSTWSPCWNILKHFPLLISLLEVSHRGIVVFSWFGSFDSFFLESKSESVRLPWSALSNGGGVKESNTNPEGKWSKNGSNSYSCVVETDCFHSIACKEGHWRTQGHSTISNETSQNQNQKQGVEGIDERCCFCFWFFVLFGLSQSCHVPPWVVSVCL